MNTPIQIRLRLVGVGWTRVVSMHCILSDQLGANQAMFMQSKREASSGQFAVMASKEVERNRLPSSCQAESAVRRSAVLRPSRI